MPAARSRAGRRAPCSRTPAHPYTRCLQLANPSMRAERRALYVMPDQMPSLRQLQKSCPAAISRRDVRSSPRNAAAPSRRTLPIAAGHHVACIRAEATPDHQHDAAGDSAAPDAAGRSVAAGRRTCRSTMTIGRGLFAGARSVAAVKAGLVQHRRERVRRAGRRKRQRQEHHRQNAGRARAADGRTNSAQRRGFDRCRRCAAARDARRACRWCSRIRNRRSIRGGRVASIVTQAMEAGSRHASWDERLARTRELLAEVGLSADFAARLAGPIVGRPAPAHQHRARAVHLPENAGRRRDRLRPRCLDPGAAPQSVGAAARRARLRHAVHFSRSVGRAPPVQPRAGDVSRRDRRSRVPIEKVFADPQHPHTRALLSSVPPDEPEAIWSPLGT